MLLSLICVRLTYHYLSISMLIQIRISIAMRRPNAMRHSDYLEQCCISLAETKEIPTDTLIIHYIQLQKITDEVGTMFGYGDYGDEVSLSPERIHLSVRAFMAKLHDLKYHYNIQTLETGAYTLKTLAAQLMSK